MNFLLLDVTSPPAINTVAVRSCNVTTCTCKLMCVVKYNAKQFDSDLKSAAVVGLTKISSEPRGNGVAMRSL